MKRTIAAVLLLLPAASQVDADIIYSIPHTTTNVVGYSYSGTITTNGSVGVFTDALNITDWSITLNTIGVADGITTHMLTSANSSISSAFPEAGLALSATELALTPATTIATFPLDHITFASNADPTGDNIRFAPGGPLVISSTAAIRDGSESPSLAQANPSGGGANFVIGTAVPEPTSAILLTVGAVGLLSVRRRLRA